MRVEKYAPAFRCDGRTRLGHRLRPLSRRLTAHQAEQRRKRIEKRHRD